MTHVHLILCGFGRKNLIVKNIILNAKIGGPSNSENLGKLYMIQRVSTSQTLSCYKLLSKSVVNEMSLQLQVIGQF